MLANCVHVWNAQIDLGLSPGWKSIQKNAASIVQKKRCGFNERYVQPNWSCFARIFFIPTCKVFSWHYTLAHLRFKFAYLLFVCAWGFMWAQGSSIQANMLAVVPEKNWKLDNRGLLVRGLCQNFRGVNEWRYQNLIHMLMLEKHGFASER